MKIQFFSVVFNFLYKSKTYTAPSFEFEKNYKLRLSFRSISANRDIPNLDLIDFQAN